MRIRKRQVPFPLSSLSPVPLSDPLFNLNHPSSPSPVVQLRHYDSSLTKSESPHGLSYVHPQPSDRPNQQPSPTGGAIDGSDIPDAGGPHREEERKMKKQNRSEMLQEEDDDDVRGRGAEEKSNDIRKGSIAGAEQSVTGFLQESSYSSFPRVGRWCEGDKVFPLKKRRGSFASNGETTASTISTADHIHHHQKDKKMKGKMKTKMNKKCARKNDDVEEQEDLDDDDNNNNNKNNNNNNNNNNNKNSCGKKRGRGSGGLTLMEGSRCSRVNGRGWRCCQQTLVGYSLCEHHLGKGRLRSMTSVRSRSLAATALSAADYYPNPIPPPPLSSSLLEEKVTEPVLVGNELELELDKDEDEDHRENQEQKNAKPLINMITKKRMKLGMVKARSISSLLLLGQTSTGAISVLHHNGKS